jgi:lipid A 3-O-deacylase
MTYRTGLAIGLGCVLTYVCDAPGAQGPTADGKTAPPTLQTFTDTADRYSPFTVTVYWENDGSILKRNNRQDRHYTNGSAISFAHQPDWVSGFADTATFGETFDRTAAGYIFGQLIFTPEDTATSRLLRKDRPYAGYLFGGVYVQRANAHTFDQAQLDLGVVGPSSRAEQAQKTIHNLINIDKPNGWDNQLGDEPTAQLFLRRKWRMQLDPVVLADAQLSQQLIPQVELAAGSVYRHVLAGATWRIGHNLPDDFGPGRLADVAAATGTPSKGWGAYGFLRVAGRVVEHDLFLEGNSYKDSPGVNAKTLVGEIQAGVSAFYHYNGWNIQANYSQTFASEQFDGQDGSDSFGALMLAVSRGY